MQRRTAARGTHIAACLLAGVLTTALTSSVASAQGESPPEPVQPEVQEIGQLFTQTAERGKLAHPKRGDSSRFNLVLGGVSHQVVWFQDRPGRQSGHIPTGSFAQSWAGFGFEEDPPNAALTVLDAPHHRDTVVLTLGTPRYKASEEKLVYPARIGEEATGNLSHLESSRDDAVRARFGEASLFIDDATAPVGNGCVIEPHANCEFANLSGVILTNANFVYANLHAANLSHADLGYATLYGAHLPNANLSYADLTGADFSNADVAYVNFSGADVTDDTEFTGARFCGTTMPDGSVNNSDC